MSRQIILAVFVFLLALTVRADIRGSWTASLEDSGKIHFNFIRRHSNNGEGMSLSQFSGLTEAQVRAETQTPVQFTMNREAARLKGLGVTPKYVNDLAAAGYKDLSYDQLRRLATHGITPEFIRRMSNANRKD